MRRRVVDCATGRRLGTPRLALGERDLLDQLALYKDLLSQANVSGRVTLTGMQPPEIIEYGLARGFLQRIEHPLGNMVALDPAQAVELTYTRNNITHLFVAPSLVACCFLNQKSFDIARLEFIANAIYPFLKTEWFLPWSRQGFIEEVHSSIDHLASLGLIRKTRDDTKLVRASGDTDKAGQLSLLAQCLLQTLERYFITIALLSRHGSAVLSRAELELLCIQTAQRISRLYGFEAPDFYDKNLFRQFISELRRHRVLTNDDDGLMQFDERLDDISFHARYMLRKEIRLVIMRLASQTINGGGVPKEAVKEVA